MNIDILQDLENKIEKIITEYQRVKQHNETLQAIVDRLHSEKDLNRVKIDQLSDKIKGIIDKLKIFEEHSDEK